MSIKLQFNQTDINKFLRNMEETRQNALVGAAQGVWDCGEHMYHHAFLLCPTDTFALRSSLYQEIDVDTAGNTATVIVGHGGQYNKVNPRTFKKTDEYAIERHERMATRTTNNGGPGVGQKKVVNYGSSKWMSRALGLTRAIFVPVVSARIRSALMREDEMTSEMNMNAAKYNALNSVIVAKRQKTMARKRLRGNKNVKMHKRK